MNGRSEVWLEGGLHRWRCGHAPCVAGAGVATRRGAHAELDAHHQAHREFGFRAAGRRDRPVADLAVGKLTAGVLHVELTFGDRFRVAP